jgi:hypothetical protein
MIGAACIGGNPYGSAHVGPYGCPDRAVPFGSGLDRARRDYRGCIRLSPARAASGGRLGARSAAPALHALAVG